MKNKQETQEPKGTITFQFLPVKYSKCPECGALPTSYSNYRRNNGQEDIHFQCGLSIYVKDSTFFKELGKCENTKEWKKTKKERLKQLESIKEKINEIVKDKKLHEEFMDKINYFESQIKNWWHN